MLPCDDVTVCDLCYRFYEGNVIRYGDEDPVSSGTLVISPAVAGNYQCRAVSPALSLFSQGAVLTISGLTSLFICIDLQ